jgi:hypothetical protein
MKAKLIAIAVVSAFVLTDASAQQFVYPAKGQKPEQQKKDEAECTSWAQQQAGSVPKGAPPPTTATGTTPGAGVRGAARGAVAAEIVGGEADRGAAAGAIAARNRSRQANAAAAQQQQQAGSENVSKARAACLEGKGYTVK